MNFTGMPAPTRSRDSSTKIAHHLGGHWKDRLEMVRYDLADVERLVRQHGGQGKSFRKLPGETPLVHPPPPHVVEHTPQGGRGSGEQAHPHGGDLEHVDLEDGDHRREHEVAEPEQEVAGRVPGEPAVAPERGERLEG